MHNTMETKSKNSFFKSTKIKNNLDYLPYVTGEFYSSTPNYFDFFQPNTPVETSIIETYVPESVKQVYQAQTTTSGNLSQILVNLISLFEQDPNLKGKYKITSGYRPGAITANGRPSNHGIGMAVDIAPMNGNFIELEQLIVSNPQIVNYMRTHNLGILDEYSEEGQKRNTGSTGPHMHIGPDRLAVSDFNKLLKKYEIS